MSLNSKSTPITKSLEDFADVLVFPNKGVAGDLPHKIPLTDFRQELVQDFDVIIPSAQVLTSGIGDSPVTVLSTPEGYFADWLSLKLYLTNGTGYATNTTAHLYQGFASLVGAIDLTDTVEVFRLSDLASGAFYGKSDADVVFTTTVGNPDTGTCDVRIMGSYILRRIYGA